MASICPFASYDGAVLKERMLQESISAFLSMLQGKLWNETEGSNPRGNRLFYRMLRPVYYLMQERSRKTLLDHIRAQCVLKDFKIQSMSVKGPWTTHLNRKFSCTVSETLYGFQLRINIVEVLQRSFLPTFYST